MPEVSKHFHSTMNFNEVEWGVLAINGGGIEIPTGSPVVFSSGNSDADQIRVEMQASTALSDRVKVVGMLPGAPAAVGEELFVLCSGTVTNLWVTGTVANGDWLALSQTYAGVAVVEDSTTVIRTRFAIAGTGSAGNRAQIKALVVPWRV